MMKKFLVLMMVLGLASIANATLQISVNGVKEPVDSEITIMPSDHLVLDIWTDSTILPGNIPPEGAYALVVLDGTAAISGGTNVSLEPSIYPDAFSDGGHSGIYWLLTLGTAPNLAINSTLIDEIDFHCLAPTDVIIELIWDPGWPVYGVSAVVDTVIIHQIPEPITMVLLGLGGLFLRRRK